MTPTDFRTAYEEWAKTAPARDSDIIPDGPRKSRNPRHSELADELRELLLWRNLMRPIWPLSTNLLEPDNDNNIERDEDDARAPPRSTDCADVIRPSVEEMMEAVSSIVFDERGRPISGDFEVRKPENGEPAQTYQPIKRLGGLRFGVSDSNQLNGWKLSPTRGALIAWHASENHFGYLPEDSKGEPLGPKEDKQSVKQIEKSNDFFAKLFDTSPPRYIPKGVVRKANVVNRDDSTETNSPANSLPLNEARAYYGLPPAANDNRPALPCGSRRVCDSFIGHHRHTAVQDEPNNEADEWLIKTGEALSIRAKLPAGYVKLLDTAMTASNFADIGNTVGYRGKNAERHGKRLVLDACQALARIMTDKAA